MVDEKRMLHCGTEYFYTCSDSIFVIRDQENFIFYEGEMRKYSTTDGVGVYMFHGYGVRNLKGRRYLGLWKHGMHHGFGVTLCSLDGRFYIEHIGFYHKGFKHGLGRKFFPNWSMCYVGHFYKGLFHGYGLQYTKSRKLKYEGFFKKGKYEGIGKEYYLHGKVFRFGYFKDGKANGEIIEYLPNGFVYYNGSMKNNEYCGNGMLSTTISKYKGEFWKNDFHGVGMFQSDDNFFYEGRFRRNRFDGKGILYIRESQRLYHGQFSQGFVHGFAKYYQNNMLIYRGMFQHGIYHGKGIYQDKKKKFFQGVVVSDDQLSFQRESFIKQMMEKNNCEKLTSVTKKDLSLYAKKYHMPFHKKDNKAKILQKFIQHYQKMIQEGPDDQNIDLFGNKIEVPCLGNDQGIYDLKSMKEYFRTNDQNIYVHHPYHWTNENTLVPKFPVVHEGRVLSSYTVIV